MRLETRIHLVGVSARNSSLLSLSTGDSSQLGSLYSEESPKTASSQKPGSISGYRQMSDHHTLVWPLCCLSLSQDRSSNKLSSLPITTSHLHPWNARTLYWFVSAPTLGRPWFSHPWKWDLLLAFSSRPLDVSGASMARPLMRMTRPHLLEGHNSSLGRHRPRLWKSALGRSTASGGMVVCGSAHGLGVVFLA